MQNVMIALGILCFAYFVILNIKRVDFCVIWLLAAVFFAVVGGYLLYCRRYPDGFRFPSFLMIALGVLTAVGLALFLIVEGLILRTMLEKPEQNLDYIIVLGAQVRGSAPSRALRLRLEETEKYLKENPGTLAVLSGGQGDGEDITEAQCMYNYLTAHGIEADRLIKEEYSTSTQENLSFSAAVLERYFAAHSADGKNSGLYAVGKDTGQTVDDVREMRVGILSNNFHVYRAKLLAEKEGYKNISGIPAASDWRLQIHYLVREFFALVKEKMMGNI